MNSSSEEDSPQGGFVPSGIGEGEGDIDPHRPGSEHYRPITEHPQFRQTQASCPQDISQVTEL